MQTIPQLFTVIKWNVLYLLETELFTTDLFHKKQFRFKWRTFRFITATTTFKITWGNTFKTLYKILPGQENNIRSEKAKVLWKSSLKGLSDDYIICENKDYKKVGNCVPKLSKSTMQALHFWLIWQFLKKSWQWRMKQFR